MTDTATPLSGLRPQAEALVARYPQGRSALLPLLHLVQHADGYVSEEGVALCAQLLGLTKAEVGAVATFYTMYKRQPMGRHLVSVCTNFSCKVRGADEVYGAVSERLGVGHNGTTADGAITLEHAECLGNCEGAPVVSVDYLNYECLDADGALELVERLSAGEVPPPTRGPTSPGVRALSHRLAGLGPVDVDAEAPAVVCTQSSARPSADDPAWRRRPPLHEGTGAATDQPATGTPERETQRQEAEDRVSESGVDPDEVEAETAYGAREFPTTDPDADPATGYADDDPRKEDQSEDQEPDHG